MLLNNMLVSKQENVQNQKGFKNDSKRPWAALQLQMLYYHRLNDIKAAGTNFKRGIMNEDGKFREENQDIKKGGGEEYQAVENFIHPCYNFRTKEGEHGVEDVIASTCCPISILISWINYTLLIDIILLIIERW